MMRKFFKVFAPTFAGDKSLGAGFSLVEMLVTLAVMSIIAGAVIVGINPLQRIRDAQDSKTKQDVKTVSGAVEACLSFGDINSVSGGVNDASKCFDSAQLLGSGCAGVGGGCPVGAPFIRGFPNGVSTSNPGAGIVCIWGTGYQTWYYSTQSGKVENTRPAGC